MLERLVFVQTSRGSYGVVICFLALALVLLALGVGAQQDKKNPCPGESSWITSSTIPKDVDGYEDCAFHQFAWKEFLAVINQSALTTWPTYRDVFPAADQKPNCNPPKVQQLPLGRLNKEAYPTYSLYAQSKEEVQFAINYNQVECSYIAGPLALYTQKGFNNKSAEGGINFHEGSIELKSAWLPMSHCDDSKYVCAQDHSGDVGLVGLHIVHKTPKHQEWIWASFEHVANDPNCDEIHTKPVPKPPGGDFASWSFYDGKSTIPKGSELYAALTATGKYAPPPLGSSTTPPQPPGNGTNPPNVCRVNGPPSTCKPGGGSNANDIACINQSMAELLKGSTNKALANYFLVGTTWFSPGETSATVNLMNLGDAPDLSNKPPPKQKYAGSPALANTTMETFIQNKPGCFACHTDCQAKAVFIKTMETAVCPNDADYSHSFERICLPDGKTNPAGNTCAPATASMAPAAPEPIVLHEPTAAERR